MSKEYFKFLSKRFISWAQTVQIVPGDRYVLSFDEQEQVSDFMTAMRGQLQVTPFDIPTETGSFKALSLLTNSNVKIVLVSTNNVTPDYLVNLRNKIGQQRGIWHQAALLFVSNQILDSINSGAKDISRQGGPFNLQELQQNLSDEIKTSKTLSHKDQEILRAMVNGVFDDEQTYTLMDFSEVYAIIEKGSVAADDYTTMGYFQDKALLSYEDGEIAERLKENHEDFLIVSQYHEFDSVKDKLAKQVAGESLIKDLASDDWKDIEYGKIREGRDALQQANKIEVHYLDDSLKSINSELNIWDRGKSETKVGQRNRQIIIFNPQKFSNVTLKLPFDSRVLQSSIEAKYGTQSESAGKNIILNFSDTDEISWEKVIYKPKKQASLKFTFNIIVLPFASNEILQLQPYYSVQLTKASAKVQIPSDIGKFELGSGEEVIPIQPKDATDLLNIDVSSTNSYQFDFSDLDFNGNKDIDCDLKVNRVGMILNITDLSSKVIPKNAVTLENFRRQHAVDGYYNNQKLAFGEVIYSLYGEHKHYLELEYEALCKGQLLGDYDGSRNLSDTLNKLYLELFELLKKRHTLMSIANWDESLKDCVNKILKQVTQEITTTPEKVNLKPSVEAISHIGEYVQGNGEIIFAPFNPILLAYQLGVETNTNAEKLSDTIERKLNPDHLVPYLKRNSRDYKAYYQNAAPRWLFYSESKLSRFGLTSQTIVTERLKDFKRHFGYLFELGKQRSYNIRAVFINEERLLLKGIVDFMLAEIKDTLKHKSRLAIKRLTPINIYLDNNHDEISSDFNTFYQIKTDDDYSDFFAQSLDSINGITSVEIIDLLKDKINVYYLRSAKNRQQPDYHITFYQFKNDLSLAPYDTRQLNMNYSLEGLIGGDEYTSTQNTIKSGFGTKELGSIEKYPIVQFASVWNELLLATSERYGVMIRNQALTNTIEEIDSADFKNLFNQSKWVTLLNPEVKLDYFNKMDDDVYVIHYTDYTNSANYESVTLTKQVDQYKQILSENLPAEIGLSQDDHYLKNAIKSFNVINGEWLLRLVSHHQQENTVKEKLSILATYKEMLGILKMPNVFWVPISLEEILRVAGSFVGENRNDAVFSAKSLGLKGEISDDLLFIGLWQQAGQLRMSFLPTEVKVGKNSNSVLNKATGQVHKTYEVLARELNNSSFKSAFYRDFFMKLYFANIVKLYSNDELADDDYHQIQEMKVSFLKGELVVDNTITSPYHHQVIFSLKADSMDRLIRIESNHSLVIVPESDAFNLAGTPTNKIITQVKDGQLGFSSERLLCHYPLEQNPISFSMNDDSSSYSTVNDVDTPQSHVSGDLSKITPKNEIPELSTEVFESKEEKPVESNAVLNDELAKSAVVVDGKHIRLGTLDGSINKSYWEYGNKQLANRHMLITGKSGQGKTYFMQMLLWELSQQHVSSLVVDYTDSYLPGQLDASLESVLGSKIEQHIIYSENLPINPFKRQKFQIGDKFFDERDNDVINRVAEVLDFVFNLGIQQKSQLKKVMQETFPGDQQYTFTKLRQYLLSENEDSKLYGRLQPLLDTDCFTYDNNEFDWSDYFNENGTINIIQLRGLQSSIQKVILEFLLWDLFQYSQMHPKLVYPVFLDEVQNLNFSADAPTVKILREGRKFGWSGIFATQSLSSIRGEVDAIYNTAEQVHFLPPENQTKNIAKMLSSDRSEQVQYEQMLTKLNKGQCIISGWAVNSDGILKKRVQVVNIDDFMSRLKE